MIDWFEFILALAAFIGTHFLPTRRALRARLLEALGRRLYFALYGVVSLAVLVWLIYAAGRAPYVGLWAPADWQRWVPALLMPIALLLGGLGAGIHYPHTLGGRGNTFDPRAPAMAAVTRHPLLWALAFWSLAHIVPNGNLAHAMLFAGISLAGMAIFDKRARATMSAGEWRAVRTHTAILSLAPLASSGWSRERTARGTGGPHRVHRLSRPCLPARTRDRRLATAALTRRT